jgi:anthranilate phosphoribosyltransferase
VLIVHGKDGMDEISLGASTLIGELKNGEVSEYEIHPEDLGFAMSSSRQLRVANAQESKAMLLAAIDGKAQSLPAARDIVTLNAGAALYTANKADSIKDGVKLAREAIASGAARAKVDEFVQYTQKLGTETS